MANVHLPVALCPNPETLQAGGMGPRQAELGGGHQGAAGPHWKAGAGSCVGDLTAT